MCSVYIYWEWFHLNNRESASTIMMDTLPVYLKHRKCWFSIPHEGYNGKFTLEMCDWKARYDGIFMLGGRSGWVWTVEFGYPNAEVGQSLTTRQGEVRGCLCLSLEDLPATQSPCLTLEVIKMLRTDFLFLYACCKLSAYSQRVETRP